MFNPTAGFDGARFIFASESGQISAWKPADSTAELKFSSPTAVYKGMTMARAFLGTFLYATNFHDATEDVFDSHFQPVHLLGGVRDRPDPGELRSFRDPADQRADLRHVCAAE